MESKYSKTLDEILEDVAFEAINSRDDIDSWHKAKAEAKAKLSALEQPTHQEQVGGNQADNPHSYANITGSTGIRVNVFAGDTELDKALRLLRAATARVDEAVTGLASNNPEATTNSANPPGTNPINTEVS